MVRKIVVLVLLVVLLAALPGLVVWMWWRSVGVNDEFIYMKLGNGGYSIITYDLHFGPEGGISFVDNDEHYARAWGGLGNYEYYGHYPVHETQPLWRETFLGYGPVKKVWGFACYQTKFPMSEGMVVTTDVVIVPYWFWLLISIVPAGLWGWRRWRRARSPRGPGKCAKCGYDLRGSAGRCPECGVTFR